MSDTPRTDAEFFSATTEKPSSGDFELQVVYADFARKLERELAELAAWKKEALLVESRWDCQRVGKLLGLTLGQDIRPNIEPKIRALLDARHQVETKLNDALVELHRHQCIERGETPPP